MYFFCQRNVGLTCLDTDYRQEGISNPDPHQDGNFNPDPHHHGTLIRIRIKIETLIQILIKIETFIRIRIKIGTRSESVLRWKLWSRSASRCLFGYFISKVLRLDLKNSVVLKLFSPI